MRHNKGFTLIETISVLIVCGVVGAVIASHVIMPDRFALDAAAHMIASDIRLAQEMGLDHISYKLIEFNQDATGYQIKHNNQVTVYKTVALPARTTITSPRLTLQFRFGGAPYVNTDSWLPITNIRVVTISSPAGSRTIRIHPYTAYTEIQ